jgi:FMN phosphatase YigB (HAD superfamily)
MCVVSLSACVCLRAANGPLRPPAFRPQHQAWKPAAAAYRFAASRLGVEPREAMMVASHPWDINGALAAGMRAAYVARGGAEAYPAYLRRPEADVPDFGALADALLALPAAGGEQ